MRWSWLVFTHTISSILKSWEFIAHIKSTAASQTTAAPLVTPQLEAFSCQLHSLNKPQIEISGLPLKKMPQDRTRPVTQRKIILATSASWVKLIYIGRLQRYNRIGAVYCKFKPHIPCQIRFWHHLVCGRHPCSWMSPTFRFLTSSSVKVP